MIEQPRTFVNEAFKTSARALGSAAEIVTNPARKLYESFSREGGSLDVMKRLMFSRLLKMRSPYKRRPLQHG